MLSHCPAHCLARVQEKRLRHEYRFSSLELVSYCQPNFLFNSIAFRLHSISLLNNSTSAVIFLQSTDGLAYKINKLATICATEIQLLQHNVYTAKTGALLCRDPWV